MPGQILESDEFLQLLDDGHCFVIQVLPLFGYVSGLLPIRASLPQADMSILNWFQILVRDADIDLKSTIFQP